MSDITVMYYLNRIFTAKNKNHFRIRNMIKNINILISQYRFLAMNSKGYLKEWCNTEANTLEKKLESAINNRGHNVQTRTN